MEKRFEILDSLPVYGPMYIPVTSDDEGHFFSTGFVVRFFKSDGTDWVANFAPGWTQFDRVIELPTTGNLLVIAGGACYLMNPDNPKPVATFGVGYTGSYQASKARIVLEDCTQITIVEMDGTHWDSERISWDGLKVKVVEENLVSGIAYDPMNDADEWVDFTYDLDTKVLRGGSFPRQTANIPRWKFWRRPTG